MSAGSLAAPRAHQKYWQDTTRAERQQKRRDKLNASAQARGWASWSEFETACGNGETQPTLHAPDKSHIHLGAGGSE
jgi:hypothetical protein